MKDMNCPQEAAVAKAARTATPLNEWDKSLAAHAAICPVCRGVVQASRRMQALAHDPEASLALPDSLPDPGLLWWRAQLSEKQAGKQAKAERVRNVLEWVEFAFAAIIPLGLATWIAMNWYVIQSLATQLLLDAWPRLSTMAYAFASLAPAVLTLAAISLAYPILAKE